MLSGSLGCGLVERLKTDVGREVNEVVRIDGEVQCGLKPVQPECPATPQPGNTRFWPHKRLRWENNLSLFLVPIAVLGFHAQANAQSNTWQGSASITRRVRSVMCPASAWAVKVTFAEAWRRAPTWRGCCLRSGLLTQGLGLSVYSIGGSHTEVSGVSRPDLGLKAAAIRVLPFARFHLPESSRNRTRMPKPCSERDRLRQAYYEATREASASRGALSSIPLGPEFTAALKKVEATQRACDTARLSYEKHCEEHGCETKFYRQRW
jgi:hypothetical protein